MAYSEDAHRLDLADKEIQKCEKELLDNPDYQSIFMEFCKEFDFQAYETIITARKGHFSQSLANANTAVGTSLHNFH